MHQQHPCMPSAPHLPLRGGLNNINNSSTMHAYMHIKEEVREDLYMQAGLHCKRPKPSAQTQHSPWTQVKGHTSKLCVYHSTNDKKQT
jgi:hypothetical protein